MILAPKLSGNSRNVVSGIAKYLNGYAEFHLDSYNDSCWKYVALKYDIKYITLHAPMGMHDICVAAMAPTWFGELSRFMHDVKEWAIANGRVVSVLFHVGLEMEVIAPLRMDYGVRKFLDKYTCPGVVNVLMENVICSADHGWPCRFEDSIAHLLSMTDPATVNMTFDLCHYQSSINMVGPAYEFVKEWVPRIKQVHFCATLNNEGYRNYRSTHGVVHDSVHDAARDALLLEKLGIDLYSVVVVPEVGELDYTARTNEIREIEYLCTVNAWHQAI